MTDAPTPTPVEATRRPCKCGHDLKWHEKYGLNGGTSRNKPCRMVCSCRKFTEEKEDKR